MHGKHAKKAPKLLVFRCLAVCLLAVVFSVSSFATVTANTVFANVIDGDESYTFSMNSTDLHEILSQAEALGLEPLGPLDVAEQVENTTTVNIRRGVTMTVTEAGNRMNIVAYEGDTVAKTLKDHNILVKDEDQVTPGRDFPVTVGLSVEIRRLCQVAVTADGRRQELSLVGGTVGDALEQAGVVLHEQDSVNYNLNEPVFDKMNIRVGRTVKLKVTLDGATAEYRVSGVTVRSALKKCGLNISDDDRLSVNGKALPEDGMHIVVTRITTQETQEREEVEYQVRYEPSEELYEGEYQLKTAGVNGEKEVVYKLIYAEGKLEGKEVLSEKVVKEPVDEVILEGTKVWENIVPDYSESGSGSFVDASGNVVNYSQKLVGECTAYSEPTGITSLGEKPVYGTVAVNPNVIPYGTQMYITSADGSIVYGYCFAGDTGGAAMAGEILADLHYDTEQECNIFGRRDMVIYILS